MTSEPRVALEWYHDENYSDPRVWRKIGGLVGVWVQDHPEQALRWIEEAAVYKHEVIIGLASGTVLEDRQLIQLLEESDERDTLIMDFSNPRLSSARVSHESIRMLMDHFETSDIIRAGVEKSLEERNALINRED